MRHRPTLTCADAHKIMAGCKAEASKNKWPVAIAIVDDAGNLLLFERLDGAVTSSSIVAFQKAQAAAALRIPSKMMGDLIPTLPGILKYPLGLPIQGGLPLMYEGECVGAVGVTGVQAHEDEQVAQAGVAAMT
jgi:uncharacterized protein GlcG (DUF336 family)